ncbi:MAG TPA: hypothetical protein VK484_09490 [Ferruginibacter sp.]|nr:hypothetical protein [Ferruginibacter sp.]
MKKYLLFLTAVFTTSFLFAQHTRLSDSIIYIDNKPAALYKKTFSESVLRYDMEVFSFKHELLIKAEAMKFDAPVPELKPFFYYELIFPSIKDTFSIYLEDEAFPLVLGKIISDYQLIQADALNRRGYRNFKNTYPGGPALTAKIKSVIEYLNNTRDFKVQVQRNRTMPVSIVNNRVIMQDGIKIGNLSFGTALAPEFNATIFNSSNQIQEIFQVFLPNKTAIDLAKLGGGANRVTFDQNKYEHGESLYKRSIAVKNSYSSYEEYLLRRICYLIANYAL